VATVRDTHGLELEILIVDDDSGDGIEDAVRATGHAWVRVLVRRRERGLATAVVHGLRAASHSTFVVMDADLSHPPEAIPAMLAALEAGAEFVVGSRFCDGGSTDAEWTLGRRLNSRVATLLARPLTKVKDPMSGFFAFRRPILDRAGVLDPLGYKIGLEILVRARCENVAEVPIHFSDRSKGTSKLSWAVRGEYLRHLYRLMRAKSVRTAHSP